MHTQNTDDELTRLLVESFTEAGHGQPMSETFHQHAVAGTAYGHATPGTVYGRGMDEIAQGAGIHETVQGVATPVASSVPSASCQKKQVLIVPRGMCAGHAYNLAAYFVVICDVLMPGPAKYTRAIDVLNILRQLDPVSCKQHLSVFHWDRLKQIHAGNAAASSVSSLQEALGIFFQHAHLMAGMLMSGLMFGEGASFQKNFCLDRLCYLLFWMNEQIHQEGLPGYQLWDEAYKHWYMEEGPENAIRAAFEAENYMSPLHLPC